MRRFLLLFAALILVVSLSSCSRTKPSSISADEEVLSRSAYEDLRASLSMWADDAEAEANFKISDLGIDDAKVAFSTLRSYINGKYVPKNKLLDSVTYLERYIHALESQFGYLEDLLY